MPLLAQMQELQRHDTPRPGAYPVRGPLSPAGDWDWDRDPWLPRAVAVEQHPPQVLLFAELVVEPPVVEGVAVPAPPKGLRRRLSEAGRFLLDKAKRRMPLPSTAPAQGDGLDGDAPRRSGAVLPGAYRVEPDDDHPDAEIVLATPVDPSRAARLRRLLRQFVRQRLQLGVRGDVVEEEVRVIERDIDGGEDDAGDVAGGSPRVEVDGSPQLMMEVLPSEQADGTPQLTEEVHPSAEAGGSPRVALEVHPSEGAGQVPTAGYVVQARPCEGGKAPATVPDKEDETPSLLVGRDEPKEGTWIQPSHRHDDLPGAYRWAPSSRSLPAWISVPLLENERLRQELQAVTREREQLRQLLDEVLRNAAAEHQEMPADKDSELHATHLQAEVRYRELRAAQEGLAEKEDQVQAIKRELEVVAAEGRELRAEFKADLTAAVKEVHRLRKVHSDDLRIALLEHASKDSKILAMQRQVEDRDRELETVRREVQQLLAEREGELRAVKCELEAAEGEGRQVRVEFKAELTSAVKEVTRLRKMGKDNLRTVTSAYRLLLAEKESELQGRDLQLAAAEQKRLTQLHEHELFKTIIQQRLARTENEKNIVHEKVQARTAESRCFRQALVKLCSTASGHRRALALKDDELQMMCRRLRDYRGKLEAVKTENNGLRKVLLQTLQANPGHQRKPKMCFLHDDVEGNSDSPTAESDSASCCSCVSDDDSTESLASLSVDTQGGDHRWTYQGIQTLNAVCEVLKKQGASVEARLDVGATPNYAFRFDDQDRTWWEMLALCHAWSMPPGSMEKTILEILQKLCAVNSATTFRLKGVVCLASSLTITTEVAIVHAKYKEQLWERVEIFVGLVDKTSSLSVDPQSMGAALHQLLCCAKGPQVYCGEKVRGGGLDLLVSVIQVSLRELFGDEIERTHKVACPECLQEMSPNDAATFSRSLFEPTSPALTVLCRNRHRFDPRVLWDSRFGCYQGPVSCQCIESPLPNLPRGEVIVLVRDRWTGAWVDAGSGFVADRERGLILSAYHTVETEFRYFSKRRKEIWIGVRRDDGRRAEIRYKAEMLVEGSKWVDACVLRITGDMTGATVNFLAELQELKLASNFSLDENVWHLGYNQGFDGASDSGSRLDLQLNVSRGYVCKEFVCCLSEQTRTEVVVNGGQGMQGMSGGPCVNANGQVVGLLSRTDSFYGLRWYLTPCTELEKLLSRALELGSLDSASVEREP